MSTGKRIKERRKELGMSAELLAAKCNLSPATIYRYENGDIEHMGIDKVEPIADALLTTPEYLMGWNDDPIDYDDPILVASIPDSYLDLTGGDVRKALQIMRAVDEDALRESSFPPLPPNVTPAEFGKVPLVGRIACGTPVLAQENIEDYVDLPKHIKADYALTCTGDSMIGAGIEDGDIVYIRADARVDDGQIAAVLIGEEATLKRFYQSDEGITLVAENPKYPPIQLRGTDAENVRLLGLAVAFTHPLV